MKFLIALLGFMAIAGCSSLPQGGTAPKAPLMTKIVQQYLEPNIQADAFIARPTTDYLTDGTYGRTETEANPKEKYQGLLIFNCPDAWMINLIERKGTHMVDPGPTFGLNYYVFRNAAPGDFGKLQFGRELEFFRNHDAKRLGSRIIDGQWCESFEVQIADVRAVLSVRRDTKNPFILEVTKNGALQFKIKYLLYETGIPFNSALFKPPADVMIIEK